jgi:2-keto-3-deoxy-L-rhamnonate aldolase RhmA
VKDYFAIANDRVLCCLQIETREAFEALDALLVIPGIDALVIGPNDLAAALGHLGDTGHPDVETAVESVRARAIARGIPVGYVSASPDPALARKRRDQGFSFVTVGVDFAFLAAGADRALVEVKRA